MARSTGSTGWHRTGGGWQHGRYTVSLVGPERWTLEVAGVVRSEHQRASSAGREAQAVDRRHLRSVRIVRNLAVIAVAALILLGAQAWRVVPNGEFGPALGAAQALESAYRAVESGSRSIDSYDGSTGIRGGSFTTSLPIGSGSDGKVVERDYQALVTMHDGDCLVARWAPGLPVATGVLSPLLPCEPHRRLQPPSEFVLTAPQAATADQFTWDPVLPPRTLQSTWFIPALVVAFVMILQALIGIALVLIRPPQTGVPPLAVDRG